MAEEDIRKLPSNQYWAKRSELLSENVYKTQDAYEKKLIKVYKAHIAEMAKAIESFIFKYAKDEKLSLQDAQKRLTGNDLADYRNRMEKLLKEYAKTGDSRVLEEIKLLSKRLQLTRIQGLMNELTVYAGELSVATEESLNEMLGEVYTEAYYVSAYTVAVGMGVAIPLATVNQEALETVLQYPYSGKHFSDRIWTNKTKLLDTLQEELIRGCIQGTDVRKLARNLREKLGVSRSNAERLVRTETGFILEEGITKGHTAMCVEKYKLNATFDSRTSKICRHKHGQVHEYKELKVGVNAPLFHVNCRTTKQAYIEGREPWLRRVRDRYGKTNLVSEDMTFEEYEEKFLK